MRHWYVALSERGKIWTAEYELHEMGFEVMVPTEYKRAKLASGGHAIVAKAMIGGYFFVRFDSSDNEEIALVKKARGVLEILCSHDSIDRRRHQCIDGSVITEFRAIECESKSGATGRKKRGKNERQDLILLARYRITRHAILKGYEGTLIAHHHGIAQLDVAKGEGSSKIRTLVSLPDCDIVAVVKGEKQEAERIAA